VSEPRYDPDELERLNKQNAEPIEIDGVTKSGYEWKQTMRRLERAGRQAKLQREVLKASGDNIGAEQAEKVLKGIRQREKRIMDKYQKIADRTGIKAQPEKMSFVKGKDSALPNAGKVVDNSGKSGIIKEKEVEYGIPYGEHSIKANISYINSEQYVSKYNNITENAKVNRNIASLAQQAIKHRSGTKFEDMFIVNAQTGEVLGSQLDMTIESGISYNESILNALKESKKKEIPIIALHNHPEGLPPSVDDFNKAFDNNYVIGIAAGHNGQVYVYEKPRRRIKDKLVKNIHDEISLRCSAGIDIDRSYTEVYEQIGLKYKIVKGD
jgi:hypothetical protein